MSRAHVPLTLALLTAAISAGACGARERSAPVLLVGVDGFEWDVALPLLAAGRMPHLAGLMQRGAYGLLETSQPTFSPVLWTTIATGKQPPEHGIGGFVKPRRSADGAQTLYSNADRRTKAVWNIASDAGREVAVVGWWMTFPTEPVHGVMVAQTNTAEQADVAGGANIWKGALLRDVPGQVWPRAREEQVWRSFDDAQARLDASELEIFGRFEHTPHSPLAQRLWANCSWAFRADAVYADLTAELLAERPGRDLTLVYLGGPDVVGHRFWRWREPQRYRDPPPAGEVADLGRVIDDYYVYVDLVLGRLLAAAAPDTRVLVVADHGMHAVNLEREFDDEAPTGDVNSGHHMDAPPGIVVVAGKGLRASGAPLDLPTLRRNDLPTLAHVLDVAPTVLALLGIVAGADMPGVAAPGLLDEAEIARAAARTRVATHDTPQWQAAHAALRAEDPGAAERLEQLRRLGYVGEDGAPPADGGDN
jgi:hypothetical protein